MRKEIMQALQQEYEQQRLKNSQEELRRRQEVITRCPEIGQYLAERQNLIFGGVRGILNGKAAADDLPARMDVMNKRIADLLRQSGFPADYLDPVYRCKQCRDTGYVGEPIREMCPCLRSAFYARLYREVGLGEKAEQSFAAFDPNVFSDQPLPGKKYSQRQLMDMLRHQCEQYAEKYPNAATMDLLLMGQSGLGKTYLMHAIAKRLLERGFNVMMISAYRFLDVARRAYFSGKQEEMDTLMDTDVLMIDDLAKGFSGRTLFEHVKMHLRAGDRVALIGDNGVGKSTLFKCIVGEEKPDCGTIRFGAGVDIGYYDQHQAHLHENKTVLDEVWDDFHRLDQTEVRGALGLFLFTGDDVLMPISTLSGGEKGRVALTKLMLKKDNVLLLDEPTNHLDMDSREVLEDALENFPGTILAISHDRYFINRFATKVCVLEAGGVKEYLGNYDDYFEKINRQQAPDSENAGMTKTAMDKEKRKSREEEKRIREKKNAIAAAEKAIATAEEEAAEMEAQLADPATYQDAEKAAQLAKAYQLKKDEIERRYAEWEELSAEE